MPKGTTDHTEDTDKLLHATTLRRTDGKGSEMPLHRFPSSVLSVLSVVDFPGVLSRKTGVTFSAVCFREG